MAKKITQYQAIVIADAFLLIGQLFDMMADFDEQRIRRIHADPVMKNMMNSPEAQTLLRFGAHKEIRQFRKIAKKAKKMAGKWEKVTGGYWLMGLKEKRLQQLVGTGNMLRDKFMTKNDETYTASERTHLAELRSEAIEAVEKAIMALS